MKLTPAALLFLAVPALAQTAKPAVHHTAVHTAAKSSDACGANAQPVLPAAIPKVAGCAKPMYALRYLDTVVGTGAEVTPRKWLTVAYTGYLTDGTKFDSSIGKDPITFPYGAHQVIPGWDTGFEGMHIGGKRRLFIPFELAYGEAGRPPVIPVKAELIFDLELIAISDNPPAPKTPPTPPPAPAGAPATPPPAGSTPPPPPAPKATVPPPANGTISPDNNGKPVTPTTDPTKPTATPPKQ